MRLPGGDEYRWRRDSEKTHLPPMSICGIFKQYLTKWQSTKKMTSFKGSIPLTSKSLEQRMFYWKTNGNKVSLIQENYLKTLPIKEIVAN